MTAPTRTPDDGPRLHLTEAGTPGAPTLLLLHAVATSSWMWEQQAELLGDFHLLIPDLPGHGASNTVPWRSLDETVKRLAELSISRLTFRGLAESANPLHDRRETFPSLLARLRPTS